jgi:hypothetical protein
MFSLPFLDELMRVFYPSLGIPVAAFALLMGLLQSPDFGGLKQRV